MNRSVHPLVRRCPRLGGAVGVGYCLRCEREQPCFRVVDCWWETFDIVRYLEDHLSADQLDRVMNARPQVKLGALVEAAEQARRRRRD